MAGISLDMDDLGVEAAVKAAVLNQIDAAARERLIAGAIDYLLKEQDGGYYGNRKQPSPLQEAVNRAVAQIANEIVRDEFAAKPEFRDAIRRELGKAVESLMAGNWNVSEAVATALASSLRE